MIEYLTSDAEIEWSNSSSVAKDVWLWLKLKGRLSVGYIRLCSNLHDLLDLHPIFGYKWHKNRPNSRPESEKRGIDL